ncbi:MAG: hypothetical protein NXI29_05560 [bacterium]|nr:hypothetical protein [bacterium]
MSLLKKVCPRRKFKCKRCASKLQNSETVWELTIPTYKNWVFDGMNPNPPAPSGQVKIYTDYKHIPQDSDGTLSYCRFDGSHKMTYAPDPFVISTAGWPAWVMDLEHAIDNVPFTILGTDPPQVSWTSFGRTHEATVQWAEPVLDGSEVETPGRWRIELNVVQIASYVVVSRIFSIIWWDWIEQMILESQGIYIDPEDFRFPGNAEVFTAVESPLRGTYYAPEDFACPILDGATYRFRNSLPTDIFPISVTDITVNDLPEGYGWPWYIPQYEQGANGMPDLTKPVYYSGMIYPTGFTRGDYLSPPYIDVRHVKRSEIDVRKTSP